MRRFLRAILALLVFVPLHQFEQMRRLGSGVRRVCLDLQGGSVRVRPDAQLPAAVAQVQPVGKVRPGLHHGLRDRAHQVRAVAAGDGAAVRVCVRELRRQVVRSVRQQAYGPDGRTAATAETDRETVLVSAYEGRQVLEALAELTSAPEVWIADGDSYTPVDIASDEAVVQRHGTLSCLEIAVRPKRKTRMSWN